MNQVDRLYRAFIDYRKETVGVHECDRTRDAIAKANEQDDLVTLERKICTVENDWIDAIEKGLIHIEKAIREERQFIRSNGEVLPIEKVKRVDKESVVHLARHSNLLTKEPKDGGDIIPDQLYTVERLSDYAVYENRFLYRLLCYLRDFITLRYDKILELTTTYNGNLSLNKNVDYKKQKMKLKIELAEQRKNDAYLRENNEAKDSLSRIDLILKAVIHYLNTPLMEEVAKVPMLKPPITKTNVLKMNQNFKGCMALYEYITAYNKPGYTVEDYKKTLKPFSEIVADEFAEAVSLISFLTYEHSMGIESHLRENYQVEEARRKEEEGKKLREQIKKLKKRIEESGMAPEEYMLMLEKRNRSLENDSAQLVVAKQEIERLNGEVTTLTDTVTTLETEVQALKDEIVEINARHEREIAELHEHYRNELEEQKNYYENALSEMKDHYENALAEQKDRYETELAEQKDRYETELAEQKNTYETIITEMRESHEQVVTELTERYTSQIDEMVEKHAAEREYFDKTIQETKTAYAQKEQELYADLATKIAQWQERVRTCEEETARSNAERTQECEARRLAESRLNAMRFECGWIKDKGEFMSKASFDELEHQYRAFQQLFKQEWKKVKKDIRTRILWSLFKRNAEDKKEVKDGQPTTAPTESTTTESATSENTTAPTENTTAEVPVNVEAQASVEVPEVASVATENAEETSVTSEATEETLAQSETALTETAEGTKIEEAQDEMSAQPDLGAQAEVEETKATDEEGATEARPTEEQ